MNRADRRRQEKTQKQGSGQGAPKLQPLLDQALAHHQVGRFDQAAPLYQQILAVDPNHAEALHFSGLLAYQTGRLDEAADLIARAIQFDKGKAPYRFNLGVVLQKQGRLDQAAAAYEQALRLSPRYAEALSNLGNVHLDQGRPGDAVADYQQAIAINPKYAEAHNNLGVALKELGRLDEAMEAYRLALILKPDHAEAQCNLGTALMEQDRLEEAIASYRLVLDRHPAHVKSQTNLGFAFLWLGQKDEALAWFRKAADLRQNHGKPVAIPAVHKSRVKHEVEQLTRLIGGGVLSPEHRASLDGWKRLQEKSEQQSGGALSLPVTREELSDISSSFNRILHYAESQALPAGAVNPVLDVAAIEARYLAHKPEITYIDDLLTAEALTSLRRFCLDSTIWKKDYANGYVGAFIGEGFSCPLFLQLAAELPLRFPGIFKGHRLMQAWAFKCDSRMKGLNLHADAAAVNVNFWITPDDANLDPEHGGLIVWDREAPKEWNFKEYNSSANEPKVREFLRSSGARAVAVPYRQNRAIVFNSDLFHESDVIRFKDDYESRRINITLLYGRRNAER